MGRIFISYRRDDSSEFARILYSRLLDDFGTEKIFLDKSSIEGGADFIGMINNSIATADVMLVIIGHTWAGAAGRDDGSRRILSSEDFVRLEVATAFRNNVLIIPVRVEGAPMPKREELPPDIEALWKLQSCELNRESFDLDYAKIRDIIRKRIGGDYLSPQPLAVAHRFVEEMERHIRNNPLSAGRLLESLNGMDPIGRVAAYVELQIRPQEDRLHDLLDCLYLEFFLALKKQETRPLWQLVEAIHRHSESFRNGAQEDRDYAKQELCGAWIFLRSHRDLDIGGHCKRSIEFLLGKL